jgi:membrane protease YdiL (CAAX protease family)
MASRLFRAADGRLAIWLRLLVAIVIWFAMLVLTEEIIGQLAGRAVGGLTVIAGSIALIIFLRRQLDHRSMDGMGLVRRGAAAQLAAGFGAGALAMGVVLAVSLATHAVRLERWNPHGLGPALVAGILASNLIFFLGVAFTEELLFRGYVMRNLGEQMPLWLALVTSSVLFGLFHGLQASPLELVEIMLGGLMLGLLRVATGTLWLAIGFHAAWDFVENGVVTTRLLPAHGPDLEQTAAGWAVPLVIVLIVLTLLARRRPPLDWTARLAEPGGLQRAATQAPQPAG